MVNFSVEMMIEFQAGCESKNENYAWAKFILTRVEQVVLESFFGEQLFGGFSWKAKFRNWLKTFLEYLFWLVLWLYY